MTRDTHVRPSLPAEEARFLGELGQQLRADSIRCSTAAGSGHPTSAMSAADLMAVLLARHLLYDWDNPREPGNDHLIFSKGHASPLLYAMFKAAGAITLAAAAVATGGRMVIAEDHYPQGGLGAAVLEALAGSGQPLRVRQCAVGGLPGSGTPDELMEAAGISASRIAAAARRLVTG